MVYENLITLIHQGKQIRYYELLIEHAQQILSQNAIKTQAEIAEDLRLTQPQVSTVLKMLRATKNIQEGL